MPAQQGKPRRHKATALAERFTHEKGSKNMSKVYIFLADGFEEIEGLTVVDLMRRAKIDITTVSIKDTLKIHGAHGIDLMADALMTEIEVAPEDMIVLPGGMPGTRYLRECDALSSILLKHNEANGLMAAICAAPSVLANLGFLKGRRATSYPTCLDGYDGIELLEDPVVTDGPYTTSRGMGTAIPFALGLISILKGQEVAEEIGKSIIYVTVQNLF